MAPPAVSLTLLSVTCPEIHFTGNNGSPGSEIMTELGVNFHWHKEDNRVFMITLEMIVTNKEGGHILTVVCNAQFQTNVVVDADFRKGPYAKVNAPAMAYPFLRAFIGSFTLSAGYAPIMLPSINFVDRQTPEAEAPAPEVP